MMKKYAWAVVLLLALSLAFFGCGPGDDGGGGTGTNTNTNTNNTNNNNNNNNTATDVETTVFDMSKNAAIQALAEGVVSMPTSEDDPSPISPLVRAGSMDINVVKAGGSTSLQYVTGTDWGQGIDLRFANFGFRAGDKVTVTGEILTLAGGTVGLNSKVGGTPVNLATHDTAGAFSFNVTLTATNITDMQSGNPAGIRIEARATGMSVRIDNITVVGMRPSTVTALPAPVLTKTVTGISWAAIENAGGYKIYNGTEELDSVPASATSFGMIARPSGTYTITVVAVGIANVSSDSPASAPLEVEGGGQIGAIELGNGGKFNAGSDDNHRGWGLSGDARTALANGSLTKLGLYFNDEINGLGNISVIFNTASMDWDSASWTSSWTNKADIDTPFVYDISSHIKYADFKESIGSDSWGNLLLGYYPDVFAGIEAYLLAAYLLP